MVGSFRIGGSRVTQALGVTILALMTIVAGCSSDLGGDQDTSEDIKPSGGNGDMPPDLEPSALAERPWEVVSARGETYLANVFYADASENEQIMPWTIDGRPQIDRLVYPTIGNPNLYVKSDARDELVVVLRLEADAYQHLNPSVEPQTDSPLSTVTLREDEDKNISFYLVSKSARATTEAATAASAGAGVVRIKPTKILRNPEPADMPAALKKRATLRFVFDKAAMASVPAGLYDARFEVKKDGKVFANVYEYQYNAVRVFDREPDEYTAINVTDTQVTIGARYSSLTADKLDDFVDALNRSSEPSVKNAAFVTFNGDLHNGGSPGTITQRSVATTYASEAKRILSTLKRLDYPVFLTAGNHDGYAALGHVPSAVASLEAKVGVTLEKVIDEQNNIAWPGYAFSQYASFLDRTKATPGGAHVDVHTGAFKRSVGSTFQSSFAEVPRSERNMVLYDGFYQWQKTYGPLYSSWTFGKNRWISMNSFELRQHRRTGWGMYTVNYGGAVSKPQLEWFDREMARATNATEEVMVLMHHDPRGGHKGVDFGYFSPMLEFRDIAQSTINYLLSEELLPVVCQKPEFALSIEQRESCLHDGLQEWMAPDPDFDREGNAFYMSGVEVLKRFVKHSNARTLILGHVHYNSMEVLQPGDELVPNRIALDPATRQKSAALEAANPVRRLSWEDALAPSSNAAWRTGVTTKEATQLVAAGADPFKLVKVDTPLSVASLSESRVEMNKVLAKTLARPLMMGTMSAPLSEPHELAIVRFTSGADMTTQTYEGRAMFGWSLLHVTAQTDAPRVNRLTFYIHDGGTTFQKVTTVDVNRTKALKTRDATNPVEQLFDW